ncbi:hypothetical protein ACFOPN_00390 [Xanthomonas hyacinthi]|uniref:hypothetical protein n=1 Tax=Xanthomonas hyacinthi TaxID=56455 RepID=UPI0036217B1D
MKSLGLYTGLVLTIFSVTAAPSSSLFSSSQTGLHISDGRLYREKELVLDRFSLVRSEPGYIFFYIPGSGLVTVAPTKFPGAKLSGRFEGAELKFSADGTNFVLETSSPIVGDSESPAWVSVDAEYSLKNNSAMVGYGDSPRNPYDWPMRKVSGK